AIAMLAVGVGVCLAAIQLLPTYEFSGLTTRAGGVAYDFATTFSFPRENLITLILPNFFGNYIQYWGIWNYQEMIIYIGIFPLILITFAIFFKRSGNEEREWIWFFAGLAIFSMLLALGKNTRIYWWVWRFVPGMNLFRAPSRFRLLVTFSAAILAGYGFSFLKDELTSYERQKIQQVIKILVLLIALVVSEILIFQDKLILRAKINSHSLRLLASIILQPIDHMRYYINRGYFPLIIVIIDWFCLLIFSLCSIILLILRIKPNFTFKFKFVNQCLNRLKINFNSIVILFVLANLWIFHIGFITTRNPSDIYIDPGYIEFIQNNAENYRVYDASCKDVDCGFKGDIPANSYIIYGFHDVRSYNSLKLEAYMDVFSCIHPLSNNTNHPILNLLNVKYILTTTPLTNSGFELVFTQKEEQYNVYIFENKQVLPKAFVLHEIKLISKNDVIRELKRASFNPLDAVLLEQHPTSEPLKNADIEGFEPVEIRTYSPNEIIVATTLTQPGFLVLSENYYPGWKAYVNGAQQEIHRAYHTLRAVYLEAGSHEVQFIYEPTSLRRGTWITILTSLFLVGTICMKRMLHLKLLRESK
ncbi:MAG: YfhO family protein, partial [Candidatus Hodarchaeota archaeon]